MENSESYQNDMRNFLNNECTLYSTSLNENPFYFLLFNSKDKSSHEVKDYFTSNINNKLNLYKSDENSFLLTDLNISDDLKLNSQKKNVIKNIYKDFLNENYSYLVKFGSDIMIKFNLESEFDDKNLDILGVFLITDKQKFHDTINQDNEDILINQFTLEDLKYNLSHLFMESDIKEEVIQEEEENFEKEFEEEEYNTAKSRKSVKEEIQHAPALKRKHKRNDEESEELYQEVTRFETKVRDACLSDNENFRIGKPTLEKIKLLPAIEKFLGNRITQKIFIKNGGLDLLQNWIKKCSDGTYPALNQISNMLDILLNLNVNINNLRDCYIAAYVMDLYKDKSLPKSIQKKAYYIVEKWSRIESGISTNYNDIDEENKAYSSLYHKGRKALLDDDDEGSQEDSFNEEVKKPSKNEKNYDPVRKEYDIYSHAKIPKKAFFDYIVKPTSNVEEDKNNYSRKLGHLFDKKKGGGRQKD
jgi:hypothetical protein